MVRLNLSHTTEFAAHTPFTSTAGFLTDLVSATDILNGEAWPQSATEAVVAEQAYTSPRLSANIPKAPPQKVLTAASTPSVSVGVLPLMESYLLAAHSPYPQHVTASPVASI